MSDSEQEGRIETLEFKIMELENTMQQLNEVILQQYRDIEHLQLQQKEILNRTSGSAPTGTAPKPSDELPPHY